MTKKLKHGWNSLKEGKVNVFYRLRRVKFSDIPKPGKDTRVHYAHKLLADFRDMRQKCVSVHIDSEQHMYMRSALEHYIKAHKLPVKVSAVQGVVYLIRTDMR